MTTEREMDRAEYDALLTSLNGGGASTPDLHTFQRAWEFDSNFVWRISEGHTHNALEAALDEIERLHEQLAEARETNTRLNRRATKADVFIDKSVEELRGEGFSLGRALANAAADRYSRRVEALEASLALYHEYVFVRGDACDPHGQAQLKVRLARMETPDA